MRASIIQLTGEELTLYFSDYLSRYFSDALALSFN